MLSRLKAALESMREPIAAATKTPEVDPARLACAALLARAAQLDGQLDQDEDAAMLRLMVERFAIDEAAGRAILEEAKDDLDTSNDIYRYTKALRDSFDEAERIDLMEMLWEVAYADGTLHDFEAQLMRRLAGLLFVDDRDSGAARKRALDKLGLAG
jgi:uncharacterized tellurite resistance protein B-like protein